MNKQNIILLIVFLVLAGLAALYLGPISRHQLNQQKEPSFLAGLDLAGIDQIEIEQPEKSKITLNKTEKNGEARWAITNWPGFYVSKLEMKEIFEKLTELSTADLLLASNDQARKARFQTDNEQGIWVKLSKQNVMLASIIVGKNTRDYNYTYFSEPGLNQTYMARGNIYGMFVKTEWRDRVIFDSDQDLINKVRFQYDSNGFTIEEKDNQWFAGEVALDEYQVKKILKIMTQLSAARIPEQNFAKTSLEKNQLIVQATGPGIDNTLMVGDYLVENQTDPNTGTKLYYAKRGDSNNLYLLNVGTVSVLQTSVEKLKRQ